jgi:phosphotransferase system HPr (HPr) family protein
MLAKSFVIENEVGLHARPAAMFVQTAAKYKSIIRVKNTTRQTPFVDAKSLLSLMGLGVTKGHGIDLTIDGVDEQEALAMLTHLIESDFAEGIL